MNVYRHSRGSVLMEFIIVLPIYLVLFGGVFMIGDMAIHATRLASAERTVAFDLQSEGVPGQRSHGWSAIQDNLFHVQASGNHEVEVADDGTPQDNLQREDKGRTSYQYADATVDCPWSLQAAMKIRDDYKLPFGGTAGRLLFATTFIDSAAPAVGEGPDTSDDSVYMNLIGGQNRVGAYSKDNSLSRTYTYNYYTLKRTKYNSLNYTWRDNRRPASDLVVRTIDGLPDNSEGVAHAWRSQVYNERWHEQQIAADPRSNTRNPPRAYSACGPAVDYQRYPAFKTWSK